MMYNWFKNWTKKRSKTDLWRAGAGIILIFVVLFILTGCGTTGPELTLATSHRGDGFIQVKQPLYQSSIVCAPPRHEVFLDYLHHSEIFEESDEVVYDAARLGYTYRFGKWKWQK